MGKNAVENSAYNVMPGKIKQSKQMTELEKYFEITLPDNKDLGHDPGQFVMISIPGIGEAPISVSSSPTQKGSFDLVVRNAGLLTNELHKLEDGADVGIRGPFGTGFSTDTLKGKDLLFVAGGIGLVPLRSLINYVLDNRDDFAKVTILYG